jgi:hypothetical protein
MHQSLLTITISTSWTGEAAMRCPLRWATRYTYGMPTVGLRLSSLPLMGTMDLLQALAGRLMVGTLPLA